MSYSSSNNSLTSKSIVPPPLPARNRTSNSSLSTLTNTTSAEPTVTTKSTAASGPPPPMPPRRSTHVPPPPTIPLPEIPLRSKQVSGFLFLYCISDAIRACNALNHLASLSEERTDGNVPPIPWLASSSYLPCFFTRLVLNPKSFPFSRNRTIVLFI